MGRLKLLGEQEGGGTDDHSALSNLGYAQSGHSGFVPSQGVALIDILRLNQNVIRDTDGNDRITLSPTSPHITLADEVKVGTRLALNASPAAHTGFACSPSFILSEGSAYIYAIAGSSQASVYSGATLLNLAVLNFTVAVAGAGTAQNLFGVSTQLGLVAYTGPAPQLWGVIIPTPMLLFSTNPTSVIGVEIKDMGYLSGSSHNAVGLKINDQTTVTGTKRLVEAGPSTPYLRLVGGGDPPANKSNLYLKFGSTLYRVVKSGSYMTLEAA